MKKIFIIFCGISIVLCSVIFIIYKTNNNKTEEVVDIFKDEKEDNKKEKIEKNEVSDTVIVDIKGMVNNPGVYEVSSNSRVNDQTCPIMIQRLNNIFQRNPLISMGI